MKLILNIYEDGVVLHMKVKKLAKIRDQYNQVPHLNQDTIWESDKITISHHKKEPKGHLFPSR